MKQGLFITFEGGDGAGKSTQINLLADALRQRGYEVVLTREPGGTPIGEKIREIILDKKNGEMADMTETMLYAAARAQIVSELIKPALAAGKIVICYRFVDSSIAYQAFWRNLGDCVWNINQYAVDNCLPDLTILLKADPSVGSKRIDGREQDRIELASSDFHQRVYEGYLALELAYPERIKGIDATGTIEDIAKAIASEVFGRLEKQD